MTDAVRAGLLRPRLGCVGRAAYRISLGRYRIRWRGSASGGIVWGVYLALGGALDKNLGGLVFAPRSWHRARARALTRPPRAAGSRTRARAPVVGPPGAGRAGATGLPPRRADIAAPRARRRSARAGVGGAGPRAPRAHGPRRLPHRRRLTWR